MAILFQGDLAQNYCHEVSNNSMYNQPLQKCLDALAHENAGMQILEVGAGTGAMTSFMIKTLTCNQAHYTDISRSFFPSAQDRFKDQGTRMKFDTLNVEADPISQGFDGRTYDLVIAAGVSRRVSLRLTSFGGNSC